MEFHISRQARDKFHFDETLFSLDGNVLFADLYAVRTFANKINQQRDLIRFPEQAARTGQINALGLLDEIFHFVIYLFRQQKNPLALQETLGFIEKEMNPDQLDAVLLLFLKEFPPVSVHNKNQNAEEYFLATTKGIPNRQLILEELILYRITASNPALENYAELFTSLPLSQSREYHQMIDSIDRYFEGQPTFGPNDLSLIDLLLSPARHVPHSLTGQLKFVREHWASFLGDYINRILLSLDLLKEENKLPFAGPGPVPVPIYDQAALLAAGGGLLDNEAFSQDRAWMPGLVLIAKNTYVWLDQLSQKYDRPINHLDQIPADEFAFLSQSGITGLWLIGLWERSQASARIKQLCGNPDAISSAYSLYAYSIAVDLGGEAAYEALRENAAKFGIRLASDMVPNHMGIDSDWVIHHPERFLALDQCPYPSYSFNGPDLSNDSQVTIQIEDHYYERTDAAVVFRRIDRQTGRTQYIYHGNDGTSMPWNDTAQLNYLRHDVQEAVYQAILEVARKFPIIRFDAAMTLAKKQIQRLWFPEPGSGGAIPSRSEHAMTREQFEAAMPTEFWREVVDRIAVEAPDTLLLAEAFWMMEGYFVRSLGMHRVYNSAFMHMLRDENNAGYRQLLKNTLEFEPDILKRYVNFMNNPDERTAVDQFGKGDKYFGICTLMATFPGLPMFGHGQIEGFAEKYGMEFRRAYLQENIDTNLVERHQREIFPLLKKRPLFAGVDNFWLFDFVTPQGQVNENVFAFTNSEGNDQALVFFNNNFQSTEGYIKTSANRSCKSAQGKTALRRDLADCLPVSHTEHQFILFRDQSSGLQFIRRVSQLVQDGFHLHLNGYEYHVFCDFKLVSADASHDYARLCDTLGEQGVPDIENSLHQLFVQPVLKPFQEIINLEYLTSLTSSNADGTTRLSRTQLHEIEEKLNKFIGGIEATVGFLPMRTLVAKEIIQLLNFTLMLPEFNSSLASRGLKKVQLASRFVVDGLTDLHKFTLLTWVILGQIGNLKSNDEDGIQALIWAEEWQLFKVFTSLLAQAGINETESVKSVQVLKLIIGQQSWYSRAQKEPLVNTIKSWFSTPEIQAFLQVNRFEDRLWYDRESFDTFLWWMVVLAVLKSQIRPDATDNLTIETLLSCFEMVTALKKADRESDYQVEKLIEIIETNFSRQVP